MEYYFLKGFFVVLLIQHCTSKDLSTSIQPSKVVTLQDGLTTHQALELEQPSAAVVPVVAPPTLKEVQQAVQEASEQVESRGAEEVLKELLERVVEAALGQVDSEVKAGEGAAQEVIEEDIHLIEKGEANTDTDEQGLKKGLEAEDVIIKGGYTGVGEEHGAAEVDTFEDVDKEGKTAAGSVVEATVGVETGGKEADGVEIINESLDTEFSQGVAEATLAALEETRVEEAVMEDSNKQDVLSKEAADTGTRSAEETPAIGEVAEDKTTQETVEQSNTSLTVSDEEQLAGALERQGAQEEKTLVGELESEVTVLPSDNFETENTQTAAGEQEEEEEEEREEEEIGKETKGPKVEDEQGQLIKEGGASEEVEAEGTDVREAEGGENDGESENREESMALVNERGGQHIGDEEQVTLEKSHDRETQETLVIPAPEPEDSAEASKEQNPQNPAPTPSPSQGGVKTEDNTLGDEKSNHGNEIITPTDDLSPYNPVVAQPTLDNVVTDVRAEAPQAGGNELGEAIELVEDITATTETRELGLEAWKIGAIFAVVFLVLETTVIVIYILKCRKKNRTQATEQTCEEGCVEPEAATGGDCGDDRLPADNGDTQQITPLDMLSTLAQNKEQHEENHAITMSDLAPSCREESDNTGPVSDSSQELRTSNL